jgi:hypothetical protein
MGIPGSWLLRVGRMNQRRAVTHARQLNEPTRGKGDGIGRRDLTTKVGRKPRRFWSVRPLGYASRAPGLSQTLPRRLE